MKTSQQLLQLAVAFEKLAEAYRREAGLATLRDPFDIAEDMIQTSVEAKDADGYGQAIELFERLRQAREASLLEK